ncbi:hypothetical protein ACU686_20060 [Yinghuangia aomiensis]
MADAPVGNTGAPNTGISAEDLMKRVAQADRDVRGVRAEFHGTLYGIPVSGFSRINASGDKESEVLLKGKRVHELRVGSSQYMLMERGSFEVLFDAMESSPGYSERDEPDGDLREFAKRSWKASTSSGRRPRASAGLRHRRGVVGQRPVRRGRHGIRRAIRRGRRGGTTTTITPTSPSTAWGRRPPSAASRRSR